MQEVVICTYNSAFQPDSRASGLTADSLSLSAGGGDECYCRYSQCPCDLTRGITARGKYCSHIFPGGFWTGD